MQIATKLCNFLPRFSKKSRKKRNEVIGCGISYSPSPGSSSDLPLLFKGRSSSPAASLIAGWLWLLLLTSAGGRGQPSCVAVATLYRLLHACVGTRKQEDFLAATAQPAPSPLPPGNAAALMACQIHRLLSAACPGPWGN